VRKRRPITGDRFVEYCRLMWVSCQVWAAEKGEAETPVPVRGGLLGGLKEGWRGGDAVISTHTEGLGDWWGLEKAVWGVDIVGWGIAEVMSVVAGEGWALSRTRVMRAEAGQGCGRSRDERRGAGTGGRGGGRFRRRAGGWGRDGRSRGGGGWGVEMGGNRSGMGALRRRLGWRVRDVWGAKVGVYSGGVGVAGTGCWGRARGDGDRAGAGGGWGWGGVWRGRVRDIRSGGVFPTWWSARSWHRAGRAAGGRVAWLMESSVRCCVRARYG